MLDPELLHLFWVRVVSNLLQIFLTDANRKNHGLVGELKKQVWASRGVTVICIREILEDVVALHGALVFNLERCLN